MSSVHCDLRSTNSATKCQQMMIPILNQDRIASVRVEWLLWLFLLLKLRLTDACSRAACMPRQGKLHQNMRSLITILSAVVLSL